MAPGQSLEARVQELLSDMTLEEKVRQMAMPPPRISEEMTALGAVLRPLEGYSNDRLGIPPLVSTGSSRGANIFGTAFPVSMARGASWDVALERRVHAAIGAEAKAIGANVLLSPTVNMLRHPGWGRAQETYGEDTFHLSAMSVAAVQGIQEHVMAQIKHYALNSIEVDRFNVNVLIDERSLREIYLPPYRAAIDNASVASVMSAYNKVNGQYMGENRHLLRDILKGEWGFHGFVASDWIHGVRSTVDAANNGLDIEMPSEDFYGPKLLTAVEDGSISMGVIDDAVGRILRKKLEFGLFDNTSSETVQVDRTEHRQLALEAAQKGMVLLKNHDQTLPLLRDQVGTIAVVGEYADVARLGDMGSSTMLGFDSVTPLQGIREESGPVEVISYTGPSAILAQELALSSDAVIVVAALDIVDEGEWLSPDIPLGGDREDLGLHEQDVELIRTVSQVNDRVIVVIEAGSAVTMHEWVNEVEAVLMAWYPGVEGGRAIASMLYGDANPSGKIPVTFPQDESQLLYPFGTGMDEIEYGYFHGYRYFDRHDLEPGFPFGHGLSYTDFEYTALELSADTIHPDSSVVVSFTLTNNGERAGQEVPQLYVGYEGSTVPRAERDLKGFAKILVDPGESRRVTINLHARDLAYYDLDSGQWVVESIRYNVDVGASCRDLRLHESFNIQPES
jgi:beta-glucosidase